MKKTYARAAPILIGAVEFLKEEREIEYVVATAEGPLVQLSEKARHVGGAAKEVIKNARAWLEVLHVDYMAKLEPEIMQLRKTFEYTRKGFADFKNKWIKLAYEHILGFDLSFNKKGLPRLGGLHHDLAGSLEKSGLFNLVSEARTA